MARVIRTVSPDVFAEHGDFSTQLHDTLRKSPWWMMSIAFHVVLALVLSLFTTTVERQVKPPALRVASTEQALEKEPELVEDIERYNDPEVIPSDPSPVNDPVEKAPETDVDANFSETFSLTDDHSTASIEGPGKNGLLGTGGNVGGAFPGRGGPGDGGGSRGNTRPRSDEVL